MLEPQILWFDIPDSGNPASTHRLACYQWGDANAARTVLCVHGLTRNGRDFDYLANALAQNYRVLCPDMPGRGKSESLRNPMGYNNPAYVADMLWMLHALNIERVRWVGTSMGGIMALIAANTVPGLIDAMVLNDVGCFIPAAALSRIRDFADLQTRYANREEAEKTFRKRCASFGISNEKQWQDLLKFGLEERDGATYFTYDPAIFSFGFSRDMPLTDIDLWALWEPVKKIPLLLIRGAKSDLLTRATAMEMQARHPQFTLHEVEGAGHAPALMDDDQTALIRHWLDGV